MSKSRTLTGLSTTSTIVGTMIIIMMMMDDDDGYDIDDDSDFWRRAGDAMLLLDGRLGYTPITGRRGNSSLLLRREYDGLTLMHSNWSRSPRESTLRNPFELENRGVVFNSSSSVLFSVNFA